MSVVVRMEMPSSCERCPMCGTESCGNGMYKLWCMCGDIPANSQRRPEDCPIICSLPEGHGRLGDLDALADDVRSLWDYKTVDGITATTVLNQTLTDIRNCPTIVPAERRANDGTD